MTKGSETIKDSVVRIAIGVAVILSAVVIILFIVGLIMHPVPTSLTLLNRYAPWEDKAPEYNGDGKMMVFMAGNDPALPKGDSVVLGDPIYSRFLGKERPLIVYLPPGYEETEEPYPVIFALHGFASRGQTWVNILIEPMEKAIKDGTLPPSVVVFPDFSVSADGRDDPMTKYDERGGSFYINSNLGRFEDHFFKEIVNFVIYNFNVRIDPEGIVLMGSSMGGYGTIYYGITHPHFSHILVPIYPAADLRYGIDGDKLADYDPDHYAPIDYDDPKRVVNGAVMGGLLGITEEWIYYNVFDSDKFRGDAWDEDKPVWERMMANNPVEMIKSRDGNMRGQRYYIIVGDKDDFNLDAHIPILVPLLTSAGAKVYPKENIIPGGRHNPKFVEAHIEEILKWIGDELKGGIKE
ncbi:MAG: hypothetical protein JW984_01020 [Deltaproteobacteria bacterium]|uniref:Esterase n=1 Tax=Candidatus Zymogenus saltonus TaxID=2844893 RepID=A0A9D8PN93_9DELT|nr:hypothetical protein [Candidatus Zymogenus saltonus]